MRSSSRSREPLWFVSNSLNHELSLWEGETRVRTHTSRVDEGRSEDQVERRWCGWGRDRAEVPWVTRAHISGTNMDNNMDMGMDMDNNMDMDMDMDMDMGMDMDMDMDMGASQGGHQKQGGGSCIRALYRACTHCGIGHVQRVLCRARAVAIKL